MTTDSGKLIEIKQLFSFLDEKLKSIQDTALDYRKLKSKSDKMLAQRITEQLITLQIIFVSKVRNLGKVVQEWQIGECFQKM